MKTSVVFGYFTMEQKPKLTWSKRKGHFNFIKNGVLYDDGAKLQMMVQNRKKFKTNSMPKKGKILISKFENNL